MMENIEEEPRPTNRGFAAWSDSNNEDSSPMDSLESSHDIDNSTTKKKWWKFLKKKKKDKKEGKKKDKDKESAPDPSEKPESPTTVVSYDLG